MLKKKILILLTAVLALLAAAGCGKKETFRVERTTEFQKFALDDLLETVTAGAFTVSDDGELFLSEDFSKICRYSAEGELLAAYEDVGSAEALCLMGQELFAATYDERLLRISLEDGKVEVLSEEFPDVQNLVAVGEYLYAYVVNANEICLKRVSPATGEVQDVKTAEGMLRAVYGSSDGHLYYCTEDEGRTLLYEYSEDKKTSTLKYDLTDRLEIYTTVQTFVCEQDLFLYTTPEKHMSAFSLTEELYASVPADEIFLFGREITCAAGNVVYRDGTSLRTVYLGDLELKKPENEKLAGTIVVRTDGTLYGKLDAMKIQELSGLKTKLDIKDYYSDEFLADLMAGNPDIDIYMIYIGDDRGEKFRREGLYEPLNSSGVIQAYRDSCFPSISEAMQTETGDIWMLPIAVNKDSLWYVEENLEKFGVDPERLRTMDSFLELSKEMKQRLAGTDYCTYAHVHDLGGLWSRQYTKVYCDVPNGIINYKTEAYRKFYDEVWTGWNIYSQHPEHPYIEEQRATGDVRHNSETQQIYYDGALYNPEYMLYKYCSVAEHFRYGGLEGWRVMPAPKFSEEVPGDTVRGMALVLNPNSRQKELAMAYLETVAANPVNIYQSEWYTSFLFSDIDVYREEYDVDQPAFRDLYELFAGATTHPYATSYPYYYTIVDDYQNGRLTLDEAIDTLQREMDMYLNE